jgi:hypothetical protein
MMQSSPFAVLFPAILKLYVRTEYGAVERNTVTLTEMLRTDEAFQNIGSQQYYWHRCVSYLSKGILRQHCLVLHREYL